MGINIRELPMLLYIMLFAAPIALITVSFYEVLAWAFGTVGRTVPSRIENGCVWVVEVVSWPVPDVSGAIPEES